MTEQVERSSHSTTLQLGQVDLPVKLYKTTGDWKRREYETASPKGKPLHRSRVEAKTAGEAEKADPIAGTPARRSGGGGGGRRTAAPRASLFEEGSALEVKPEDVRKGIRKADGEFVDLTDHLEQVAKQASLDRMEVLDFIAVQHVPHERILGSYYLAADGASDVLGVLHEALKERRRMMLVRWTKRKGQSLGLVKVLRSGALCVLEVAFAEHFRAPNADCLRHLHVEVNPKAVAQAGALIDVMAGKRSDLDDVRDRREQLEDELVARAEFGDLDAFDLEDGTGEPDGVFDDLEAVLAESVAVAAR